MSERFANYLIIGNSAAGVALRSASASLTRTDRCSW